MPTAQPGDIKTDKHLGEGGTQMFACCDYYTDKEIHRQEYSKTSHILTDKVIIVTGIR